MPIYKFYTAPAKQLFSKIVVYACFTLFFYSTVIGQSVSSKNASKTFTGSFNNNEGQQQVLTAFKGKKIWLIVLPDTLSICDSSVFNRIDSIAAAKYQTVQTIIIPAQGRKGFITDGGAILSQWYKTMKAHHIIFSNPLATRKGKKASANDIVEWLTNANLNGHFEQDIDGNGAMYMLNNDGELIGKFDFANLTNLVLLRLIFQ